ncbi:C40 family peptidase [Paenibacillus albus]|uniref:NlpC/P60 family protein n=1 Tax=Paenibacillus albus TaxID=2495582 RepID=A0A3S9AA93_9BACL|nr:NlpC/P60 family protein [Paenibacillus albus]AZN42678.1 NlpC/P60 family protein [Paenibacillus albus]
MKKRLLAPAIALTLLFSASSVSLSAPASAQEIYATHGDIPVAVAQSYIGKVRYHLGTRDPQHLIFDCSSFTQFVFKQALGINIPWGSSEQTKFGIPVNTKAGLSIGDLVMFSVNTPGHINHVGIYIGNGQFISNMPGSGVAISSLNSGYWSSRFITGRHY